MCFSITANKSTFFIATVLRINFVLTQYAFEEGSDDYPNIALQYTNIERPFNITLSPVNISSIENVRNFSRFIDFTTSENPGARATAGINCLSGVH